MAKTLNDFVKDNSKFLRLQDGESFEGIYVAFKVTPSTFDPEKETCIYKLKYEDGKEIYWQTASVAVARVISKYKGGEAINIKRQGSGTKTKYVISSPDITVDDSELQPDEELPEDLV